MLKGQSSEPDRERIYDSLREVFVRPLYLSLLHANFLKGGEALETFPALLALASHAVSAAQLHLLLDDIDWRARLTAAWLVGITRRKGFTEQIISCLEQRRGAYDEQGFCLALGMIGTGRCKAALYSYLQDSKQEDDGAHSQWATGAIAHVERHKVANEKQHFAPIEEEHAVARFAEVAAYLERVKLFYVDLQSN